VVVVVVVGLTGLILIVPVAAEGVVAMLLNPLRLPVLKQ
jgi:hypothetical protein